MGKVPYSGTSGWRWEEKGDSRVLGEDPDGDRNSMEVRVGRKVPYSVGMDVRVGK